MTLPHSPDTEPSHDSQYQRIAKAIAHLQQEHPQPPSLRDLAATIGLSPDHTQKLFQRWAGLSPKAFQRFLSKERALELLQQRHSVENTSLAVGLSSSSRLHDLILHWEAVTPGSVRKQGKGLTLTYGWHDTVYGQALIAISDRGLCHLAFNSAQLNLLDELQARWPLAQLQFDARQTQHFAEQLFKPHPQLPLHIIGSQFQHKVWEALLRIPAGQLSYYGALAHDIDQPSAARAVGHAIGQNPIGWLIPCHRVIRANGEFGGYHWGGERKISMLMREQS